ncbi:winged helix-turn-helix transcriptional regulator [Nonomuraea sp. PA05]|uniref:winged helix-turn-helix domain-containing protein n=1 Tax=Nonomuraea sp. PA05 TaxID=2604466 RepID=UPI0011DBA41D|nr:winged helix-turn-helix domain-containing protein [Nonomuraea sp. PA05]TYB50214.1 winged helix-turn-helix transcriptional regulator [Nonomuraea sp. PA05]
MVVFRAGEPQWRRDIEVWRQLSNEIRNRIKSGVYKPGHMLTQNTIAQEFGVAPNTVRKAFADLREKGLIYTRIRLGSFVGPEPEGED